MTQTERIAGYSRYMAAREASASLGLSWDVEEGQEQTPDALAVREKDEPCQVVYLTPRPALSTKTFRVEIPHHGAVWVASVGLGSEGTLAEEEAEGAPVDYSDSPFDELFQQQGDEEKVRDLIDYVRKSLKLPFADRLAHRLEFLLEVGKEEEPDKLPVSPESLRNFVAFLQSEPYLRYPDVVLSPARNIRAQWRVAPNKHFAAEFLPTGDVRFVVFAPRRDRTLRLSGITSVDSLMDDVRPHDVLNWAAAE